MKDLTEDEKKEIIDLLKQLEGVKRKLHALLKGDANDKEEYSRVFRG